MPGLASKPSSNSFTCSGGLGAPPAPRVFNDDKLYLFLLGWFNNSHDWVGTPVTSLIFSSSIQFFALVLYCVVIRFFSN